MNSILRTGSDEQFVEALYQNLLARNPDPDGMKAFLGLLRSGKSRLDVIEMFFGSEEFAGIRQVLRFAPPGHFYSPYPSRQEIRAHHAFDWDAQGDLPAIDLREPAQKALAEALATHYPSLPFAAAPTKDTRYGYENSAYSYCDGIVLFGMIRHLGPRRIIEVGSGHSSCAILDSVDRMQGPRPEVTFIEPYGDLLRSLVRPGDLERNRLHEQRLQDCPVDMFRTLQAGDILFIDSSHVAKLGSDVNYLVFEILPALAPGVWVHIHDVFHPFDYPAQWYEEGRAWNEAYVLRAFLEFNEAFRIEFFSSYMLRRHRAWFERHMPLVLKNWGGHIWLSRVR